MKNQNRWYLLGFIMIVVLLTSTDVDDGWYTIENYRFGINNAGKNPRETTNGINRALEWAISTGLNKVRLDKGTYLIRSEWSSPYVMPDHGISVPSGMMLDLGSATLMMEPNSDPNYFIISIAGKDDVTITGGTLVGDRYSHKYDDGGEFPTHEWGFGIIIAASTNVLVKNVAIMETTGDGIILEGSYAALKNNGKLSSNVKIFDCTISDCRRQGISVVGAIDSEIAGNKIFDIQGTAPEYGIDVEPGLDFIVENLKIHDNLIFGCAAGAISCHSGSGYEVFSNRCIDNNIIAVQSSDVSIYKNIIESSMIRVFENASNIRLYENNLDEKSRLLIQ